ncbi:MAG: FecR family protein [Candidatus Edwardsbacteria bacterium]|nr:FecR family protein [Candidatus Edwardsbacteria bacterium]
MIVLTLLLLNVSGATVFGQDTTATLILFIGDCYVWHHNKTEEADIGQALYAGDSIRTGKDSRAELNFSDGTVVRLGDNTRFFIRENSSDRSFQLLWGKFWAKVVKLAEKSKFEVESPTAVAGVRGTVFKVEVDKDSTSRVAVEEGMVEVTNSRVRARQIRLAALQESFVKRRMDPSDPRSFDPSREARWECWTKKLFFDLLNISKTLLTGLTRAVKDEEKLLQAAQTLKQKQDSKSEPGPKLLRGIEEIQHKTFENRRKFRLLLLRAEKRFRQARILTGRIDEQVDIAPLAAEAEALKSQIDRLSSQFETCDSQIMNLLDRMDDALDQSPQGQALKAGEIIARIMSLENKAVQAQNMVQTAGARLDLVENALSEFMQAITQIRNLVGTQPQTAREQLFAFRRKYFLFKQANGSFEYPALDKLWLEARAGRAEARRLLVSLPRDDARSPAVKESMARIVKAALEIAALWQRSQKIQRQGQMIERMILETDAALKSKQ